MVISPGDLIEHPDFGVGTVKDVLGDLISANFFGEHIDVNRTEVTLRQAFNPIVRKPEDGTSPSIQKVEFRRAFEAINLGVVPPDPRELIGLTIGSSEIVPDIKGWLANAGKEGLCKVVFGYYGAGKSHFLNVARYTALEQGWVVSYVEFDPKEADPAKPHLVYRNIMAGLEFPEKEDGTRTEGFYGFIKEIRDNWSVKSIRSLPVFRTSPWFSTAIEILLHYPHILTQDYKAACDWLAGDNKSLERMNQMAKNKGYRAKVPRMPVTRETADIYVHHLVVISELCKTLGYKGFLIILDEAEHVRGYNTRRQERANNFFDILARCSHLPVDLPPPRRDYWFGGLPDQWYGLPEYWQHGPYFGLFVGLTGGKINFSNDDPREECVFLHRLDDCVFLRPPTAIEFWTWCFQFITRFVEYYPAQMNLLKDEQTRTVLANTICDMFLESDNGSVTLRNWIKLVSLVPCIILARETFSVDELVATVKEIGAQYTGQLLPWEI